MDAPACAASMAEPTCRRSERAHSTSRESGRVAGAKLGQELRHGALDVDQRRIEKRKVGRLRAAEEEGQLEQVMGRFVDRELDVLLATCGDRLLRVKGLVHVAGEEQPRVVHCVQHTRYPTALLEHWPEQAPYNDRSTRLVFIVRGLARDQVEKAFTMFCGGIQDADAPQAAQQP